MSQTFSLVCHETRQTLWIGQGHRGVMSSLYAGEEQLTLLRTFLAATIGKPLVLVCNDTDQTTDGYEELDDPNGENAL